MAEPPVSYLFPLMDRGRVDNVLYWAGLGFSEAPLSPLELEDRLTQIAQQKAGVVFPSHFFEYEHRKLALERGSRLPSLSVQLSPGSELALFFEAIKNEEAAFTLELIMDRPLHALDLERITELEASGRPIKTIVCPTREFDALTTYRSLPDRLREAACFYFAPKRDRSDRFLDSDEIFLLTARLKNAGVKTPIPIADYLHRHEPAPSARLKKGGPSKASQFRRHPEPAFYLKNYVELGEDQIFRKVLKALVSNPWLSWLGVSLYYFFYFVIDPAEAVDDARARAHGQALRSRSAIHGAAIRAYWRIYAVSSQTTGSLKGWGGRSAGIAIRVALRVHARLNRLYWKAYGLYRGFFAHCKQAYWSAYSILRSALSAVRHPIWFLKIHVPPLYWVLIFPLQKLWWFGSFQFSKRILGKQDRLTACRETPIIRHGD